VFCQVLFLLQDGTAGRPNEQVPCPAPFEVVEHRNIVYRPLEKGEMLPIGNRLDLYLPKGQKNFPVLFMVHGGAWIAGDKRLIFAPSIARCFAKQGLGVVSVNYRLYPWVRHPGYVVDVAKAFAWTQQHIAEYGGKADEIFLAGHSAGGHIVTLLATDKSYLRQVNADPERIQGVIAVSGVYLISDVSLTIHAASAHAQLNFTLTANPYKPVFGKDAQKRLEASPLTHVQARLPPFLLVYAEHDLPTLAEMAQMFAAALRDQRCDVQLLKAADRNHVTEWWDARKPDDPVARAVMDFVRKHRLAEKPE
jgi:acetyl esterase/lipase